MQINNVNQTVFGGTSGSVPFIDSSGNLVQSNNAFHYDSANLKLSLVDKDGTPYFSGVNYLFIGSNTTYAQPTASHLTALQIRLPLTLAGTSKYTIGQFVRMDLTGTPTTPSVFGHLVYIFTNTLQATGGSNLYGTYSLVDVGTVVNEAVGGSFTCAHGSSAASGSTTIVGIRAIGGMGHNGDLTNCYGGEFRISSSASSPSITTNNYIIKLMATVQSGCTATDLRGMHIGNWTNNGTVTNSAGIYIDATIDVGATTKNAIKSLSTSPSEFAGDLEVTDSAKGVILKSPNGTRWRISVSNAGAISATSL